MRRVSEAIEHPAATPDQFRFARDTSGMLSAESLINRWVAASSLRFREGQCRNRTLPPARERPDIILPTAFPATYQWLVVATSLPPPRVLGAILTVECAAGSHEAAVVSSALTCRAVVLMVKFSFGCDYQGRKKRNIIPSADGFPLLAE